MDEGQEVKREVKSGAAAAIADALRETSVTASSSLNDVRPIGWSMRRSVGSRRHSR